MLTLHFNDQPLGNPTALEIRRDGAREVWHVDLDITAPAPAGVESALEQLKQFTEAALAIKAGAQTVRDLAPADCRVGPALVAVTAKDAAPGGAHGLRRVRLRFEAERQDADAPVQAHAFTATVVRQAGKPSRLRLQGRIELRRGEDPAAHESELPPVATGERRVKSALKLLTDPPALEYELEDETVFHPLPGGIEDGHVMFIDARDADGRRLRATRGFFVGDAAAARALEFQPSAARLLHRELRESPHENRVDFEYREALPDADGLLGRTETLSFTTTRRVIDHPLLAPLPAWRQEVGLPATEIIQEGAAAGHDRHPAPPPARYAADLVERRVHYSTPHAALPADQRYVTRWRYLSRTRAPEPETIPEA